MADGIAHHDIRVTRGELLAPACPPASVLDGLLTLTRPRSQPPGDTRSRLLSPTTPTPLSTEVTLGAPRPPRAEPKQIQPSRTAGPAPLTQVTPAQGYGSELFGCWRSTD